MTKFVFVTGGVVSGLGKGITASSLALLLKQRGYKVFMQKFDPYINVDPGTMSPYQHGEVFVTADGSETDLDLGHYERFIDEELNYTSNITTGKVYSSVIEKERKGDYLGATVQIIPHVTNEIKAKVYEAAATSGADIVITEVGGTVGDMESMYIIEALRQLQNELGRTETCFVHTTLVPYITGSEELKSKPTQNSVIELRKLGIQPNLIVTRSPFAIGDGMKAKISLFCSIPPQNIIESIDVKHIYQIPLKYYEQEMDQIVLNQFNLPIHDINLKDWKKLIQRVENLNEEIEIALVGKYVELHDAYLSVAESLRHAGYHLNHKIKINWVNSEKIKDDTNLKELFKDSKGIIVPGGFGNRGIKGKMRAIEYARKENVPFIGICLGMQLACIEFARNVCHLKDVNSIEFKENCKTPIIDLMEEQKALKYLGGTLRLGNYNCHIKKNTLAYKCYKQQDIVERHRHRYEFSNQYKEILENNGFVFSGENTERNLMEIIELKDHKFFIATQYHPEFKSRPTKPHPLFVGFIEASIK